MSSPNDWIGLTEEEIIKEYGEFETEEQFYQELDDYELNTCDCCNRIYSTYELIWISSEDFIPKKQDKFINKKYEYDALCEECYKEKCCEVD